MKMLVEWGGGGGGAFCGSAVVVGSVSRWLAIVEGGGRKEENVESFCTNFKIIFLSSAFVSPHYDIHMMFCFTFMSILCRLHNVSISVLQSLN